MFPLVSVIIPSLNRNGMLRAAINSVLSQSYNNVEIIVIDDFSDEAVNLTNYSTDIKIRLYRNNPRRGGAYSRLRGVSLAKGNFVAFLDDDDIYYENKLQTLIEYFNLLERRSIDADVVFGLVERSDNKLLNRSLPSKFIRIKDISAVSLLHTNGSLIKRSVFTDVNFYPELKKYQDTQLHIELIMRTKVYFTREKVALWNVSHEQSQITDMKNDDSYLQDYYSYLCLYNYLLKRCSFSIYDILYLKLGVWVRFNKIPRKLRERIVELSAIEHAICLCINGVLYIKRSLGR